MAKIDDVEIPTLLFDEQGSDPSTPASTLWRLYFKATGFFHKDDAGVVRGPLIDETAHDALDHTGLTGVGGGGGIVSSANQRYTAGNITVPQPNMAALTGPSDLTLSASSGDILLIGLSARNSDSDADSYGLDMATIVSASPVNYLSSHTGTPITTGVAAWFGGTGANGRSGGAVYYVVQSGDISGGNVTLRHYGRASGAGKSINADGSAGVFESFAINLGQ